MGTSLIQQLLKLAAPETSFILDEKKKASILFDPKEAASFDRETFFELGVNGLEELKKLNMRFDQFEDTLFDVSSKDLQRAVQSKEVNKKLNREISKFLGYLSPYFLLKCAHQALEWLIQRFQIHKYNVDDLMMLILPYHETNIFVRVLQIINVKEPTNRWHWLHRLQNAGVPLSKTTLLNHCSSSTSFLSFVCHIPTTVMKLCSDSCSGLHTLCTFCCMTIVGALEHSKEVSEVQVSHILKLLIETLTSPFLEFSCMSIVITAQLARTVKISEQVLLVLVNKLSKVPHVSLESECCAVLSLLYLTQQETLSTISDTALINFTKSRTFITSLQKIIDGGGDIFNFTAVLIKEASKKILQHDENQEDLQNFLEELLSSITLNEDDAEKVVLIIIDSYILRKRSGEDVENDDDDDDTMDVDDSSDNAAAASQSVLQWYSSFLRSLERQYSVVFDTVVKKVLENTKDERKRRSLLDILGFMPKVNFQISGIDMFEKLHHPSVSLRVEGIKYLLASVNKVQSDDKEFVQNILRNRLQEDSYKVVEAVLECPASELASLVGEEFFVMQMIKISAKYWHMSQISDTLKSKVVAYLCSDASFKTKPDAVFFAVLPYLLPKSDEDVPFAICALKSEFASKHKVMSVIQNEIQNLATVTDADFLCSVVSKLITNKKHIFNTTELISMINEIPIFKTDPVYKFIGTILMTASITKATTVEVKWKIMDTVLEYFASSNVNEKVKSLSLLSDQTMSACMQVASKRKLPIQGLLFCLQTLTKNIELPEDVTCRHWWDISSIGEDFHKSNSLFFIKLFEVLLVGCMGEGNAAEHVRTAYICYLKNLFTDVFPNLQAQLGFLSNLWVSHEFGPKHKGIASYELQLRSLLLARSLLLKTEESVGWTMNITTESIIPPLLISLSCPMGPVRVAALECFGALRNTFGAALNRKGYHCLLSNLLEFEEELKLDAEQISVVLYKLLSPDEAVQSCYTSTQRRQLNIIMNALFDCVVQNETPLHFKAALLKILSHVNSSNIMNKLAPVAKEVLSVAVSSGNQLDFYRSAMLRNIFSRFENDTYSSLTKHKEVWNLFKTALFDYKSLVYEETSRITCPSIIAMNQISKDFFDALPNNQQDLLSILVSVATEADSPDVVSAVGHVFKKIVLECKHVVLELEKVRDAQCAPDPLTLKRRTRSQTNSARPSVELLKTKEWHEGTTLLELIQNKKKLRGVRLLFPVLFDLLKRCLDFEEQAPVEYIKQLILSSLLHCCQKLSSEAEDNTELSEKEINVELVVQCIRASQNPQTHHHALLVLSQLAGMIPEQVLHNIMAIFTFMGSSILRQDDAYSFQIISKVVDTVIPILVKANEAGVDPRKLFDPVAGVLRVFVDALVDIPEHRQMPLFHKLMVTLGEENFLWLLMALVIESHVRQRTAPDQNKDGMLPKKLNFVVNLTLRFHPLTAIKNSIRLMEYLQNLPMEKDQKDDKVSDQTSGTVTKLFDVSNCSKSEFHHFKYAIVIFLSGMMGDPNFINQVAALPTDEVKDLEQYYAHLIECVLQHIQISVHASEINVGKPTAKFWKCMLAQSYDLLDKVNALLLSDMFLHVILSLLNNTIHTVRRRAMELMNARLQNEEFFMSCKTEDLLSLVKPLLSIISTINEENISFDEQLNQQTALASMKLMARLMASKHIEIFGEILDNLTDLIMKKTLQGNVLASALLCGAELCSCLKAFAVSNLPKFMPALLKVFKKEKKTENPDVVLLAIVTAVHKVVESLPHFLSPYLEQLLLEVSIISSRFLQEEETQKIVPIVAKLDLVRQKLSSEVPLRVLMPVVNTSYFRLLKKKHYEALGPLMSILAGSFAEVSSADFNYLRAELSNFFMAALQFRSDNEEEETSLDIVDSVEGHVIKALVALVLKLSESSFRPLYYNLFHWATALDVHKERLITFYRVSHSIAECLKGLFVLFAGHFIKNAASLLDQTNLCKSNPLVYGKSQSGKAKSLLLLDAVLKTLHSIFLYDSAQFLNKERFDTLMQPLVDQLENTLGGLDMYKERASTLLTPCIVQFAVVTADDSLWKQLNYQILLKTRNSVPMVRLMALQTVCGVAQKLGDDFLTQLPETVPFLAELMEDEEEEVEQACVKVVQEMEEILGEPLKKYF